MRTSLWCPETPMGEMATMSASPNDTSGYRRNVPLLVLAQGLFMTVQSMGTVTLPLAALAMLEQKWLATMPLFLNHAGIMVLTIPAWLDGTHRQALGIHRRR